MPNGLRTVYPLTAQTTLEAVRKSVQYELPPLATSKRWPKAPRKSEHSVPSVALEIVIIAAYVVLATHRHSRTTESGHRPRARFAAGPCATRCARTSSERLKRKETLFPGIIGYDDTVIPQLVNAVLARHHFILLGLRGQAKTRILRALTTLLDEWLPVIPESEINDDPIAPLSAFGQQRVKAEGDQMPVRWLPREARYVEKLATPDVTIADMIGDIDPIKAAKGGLQLGSELSMHFGLLPRANRGIFAINELPDLAGKIQVGLFNILQEGDVQIKGYPVRLPLDVLIAFTANPEDYTARGKIITPLKDRIGAEIRTHYMQSRADALTITEQEAWVVARRRRSRCRASCAKWSRRSRSRRAASARSTSARASASACRSACSKPRSRTPSGARSPTASRRSCRASPTSTPRCRR